MSMTITLSDYLAGELERYLGEFRRADKRRDEAFEAGDVRASIEAKDDQEKSAMHMARLLSFTLEGTQKGAQP